MKNLFWLPLFFIMSHSYGQQKEYKVDALVSPLKSLKIITVGGPMADILGFDNKSVQYAIDSYGPEGGTVRLLPGTFLIESPIKLKSNIKLIGSGPDTKLQKTKGVQTKFIIDADYGELKITVDNPDGFLPGMKIQVTDNENSSCWNVSTAYITNIEDNVIYIDDYLIRDYRSDLEGLISNACSLIEIIDAENVIVESLFIDGMKANNYKADGCNSSGIYIFKSKKVTVDKIIVKDFNGEGISWQITENVTIKNCEISGSGNTGLHPGTGSPLTIIENNNVHHNQVDGLFICWRVHHSIVRSNKFHNNGRYGICTGHKDTDVLFEGNHIYNNGSDGINLRGERADNAPHRNIFSGNIIENNGLNGSGYGMSFNSPAEDIVVKENIIRDTGQGTQVSGLFFYKSALPALIEKNKMEGHSRGDILYESNVRK